MIETDDARALVENATHDKPAGREKAGGIREDLGRGGIFATLPISVVCEGCGETEEFRYAIDLSATARKRGGLDQKSMAEIHDAARRHAIGRGWLVSRGAVYCPGCADRLSDGDMNALHVSTDASGLIDDMLAIIKARSGRADR